MTKHSSLLVALLATALTAGCADPSGVGHTSVAGRQVTYGIGEQGVAFAMFTDMASGQVSAGAKSSSGISSEVSGYLDSESSPRWEYSSDFESITIGGEDYSLQAGAVFLVSNGDAQLSVRQLDVDVRPTVLSKDEMCEEVNRMAENEEVARFLAR